MRDKFHFNLREDKWELKSKKGFIKGRCCRERGVWSTERRWLEKEQKQRKTERSLLNTPGKPASWRTKHRKSEAAESESGANNELI